MTGTALLELSAAQMAAVFPGCPAARRETLRPFLNEAMVEFEIAEAPLRVAAFVAQLGHESVDLTAFEEFASGAAYEGRSDLGNTVPGDGRRFKGRGPIQLTGRANYRRAGRDLGLDLENNPERAADEDVGFRIAGWYWKGRGLNTLADLKRYDAITKLINGGYNHKAQRDARYARARKVLGC